MYGKQYLNVTSPGSVWVKTNDHEQTDLGWLLSGGPGKSFTKFQLSLFPGRALVELLWLVLASWLLGYGEFRTRYSILDEENGVYSLMDIETITASKLLHYKSRISSLLKALNL